jgi:hypothetical protein
MHADFRGTVHVRPGCARQLGDRAHQDFRKRHTDLRRRGGTYQANSRQRAVDQKEPESRMSERSKFEIDWSGFGLWFWLFFAWVFWWQSGWYRVDCALKIERACDLIRAEYAKKEKP